MAITCTWTIENMVHNDSDGGVITVYWRCSANNDEGPEGASSSGKFNYEPDASSPDFTPYADLTESQVLGWVYASLAQGDETPEEAKLRVEADRTERVQGQIDRAATQSDGMPW